MVTILHIIGLRYPFEAKAHLKNIYRFSSYCKENTMLLLNTI
jgi:hypothetical protein